MTDWDKKFEYYNNSVKAIRIQSMMEGQDVRNVVAGIDEVLNSAFFDLSEAQTDFEAANAELVTKTSEAFLRGKDNPDAGSRSGGGMSDEKAKAYSRATVAKDGLVQKKLDTERRLSFMENVVKLLQEKRALLIISYGTIKIESTLS